MVKSQKPTYTVQVTLRMTEQMYDEVRRRARSKRRVADWVRQAVREQLDQDSQERLEKLPNRRLILEEMRKTRWYMMLLLLVVARIGSVLIKNLIKPPEQDKAQFEKSLGFSGLMHLGRADLEKYGHSLLDDIEEAIEATELAAVRQAEQAES